MKQRLCRAHFFGTAAPRLCACCLALFWVLLATSCKRTEPPPAEPPVTVSPDRLAIVFRSLQSGEVSQEVASAFEYQQRVPSTDANWPTLTYLVGEMQLKARDLDGARSTFRSLATWGAAESPLPPYKDGWGGSGLTAIAYWRWLQLLDTQDSAPEEIAEALKVARALYRRRLVVGMVSSGLLPALPRVEEDASRLLAHVLWKVKMPEANSVFLAYVSMDSVGEYDQIDELIVQRMLDEGLATRARLDLFRYRRQLGLVMTDWRKDVAADKLHELWNDPKAPTDVRTEAGYEWSNYNRRSQTNKNEVVSVLGAIYDGQKAKGLAAEKALYLRGVVENSVPPRRLGPFLADLSLLLERFPNSKLVPDALYQLGSEYLFGSAPNLDQALPYFARLRAIDASNEWLDSAYFLPAVGLIDRGSAADLQSADQLLAAYVQRFPNGVFRGRCLFWRGRIAELQNDRAQASQFFQQIVKETPFDYYGIRARMHLEDGPTANKRALPLANSETWKEIRAAYHKRAPDTEIADLSPYHARLRSAGSNGLYKQLLTTVDGIGKKFRNRLDLVSLNELDKEGLIPAVAVLLSLRQDALAARDTAPTADNYMRLSGFLGRSVGDWPLAEAINYFRDDTPRQIVHDVQNDDRYLSTVYPDVNTIDFLRKPLADAAWSIDGSVALSESLMYAIVRRESSFYAGAISARGAIGLFQVLPATFIGTKACWKGIGNNERAIASSYLFDPIRNIAFWSCWVGTEKGLRPNTADDVPRTLVMHNAGRGNLARWMEGWKGRPIEQDLELQIDTYRFPATQLFVRSVLADVAITSASGIF